MGRAVVKSVSDEARALRSGPPMTGAVKADDVTAVPLGKGKILLLIAGSVLFVAAGYWMFQLDPDWIRAQQRFNSPPIVYGVGMAAMLFFGLCGAFGILKLFDKRPGLVFGANGLLDNSSAISAGLIPWHEIVGFDVIAIQRQKLLVVRLVAPEKYAKTGGAVKSAFGRANLKRCGSPVVITSNALRIGFDELVKLCDSYFARYGRSSPNRAP